jgi:hypothetical protein
MELARGACAANNFVCWRGSRLERWSLGVARLDAATKLEQ